MFVLCASALMAVHRTPPLPVPAPAAIRTALANPLITRSLRGTHTDRTTVDRVDDRFDRVSFYSGARIQAEVEVDARGSGQEVDFHHMPVPYGSWIAYIPALVAGLAALFVLMTAVAPLWRLRNLDVVAVLSLLAPVALLKARYIEASVLASAAPMLYLLGRCASYGLGERRPAAPSTPLWSLATSGLDVRARVRILRLVAIALALAVVMIGVSSNDAVDVIYAVMEGATNLVHGLLPYGHMPGDVVHGDTYPILSYALYVPLALVAPVSSRWNSVDLALAFTALVALGTAAMLAGFTFAGSAAPGRGRPRARVRSADDVEAGLRGAIAWLAFPPLVITVSTGTTDVVLAGLLVVAVLVWRRPSLCSAVVGLTAWFKLAPAALLVFVFAPLTGKARGRAFATLAAVSVPLVGLLIAFGGAGGFSAMIHAVAFQFSRGSQQSIWSAAGLQAWQPIGQAGVLALLAAGAVRLRQEPALAEDRQRMAALAAAVLIGLQLVANYWAFLYVVWFVPLVALSVLSPARTEPATVPVAVPALRPVADAAPA